MKLRKLVSLLTATTMAGGLALVLQGCYAGPPAYGYGGPVYSAPAYYPAAPVYSGGAVVSGDWDEHHAWHDRNWWVANRRPWVEQHHSEWLAHNTAHDYAHQEHVHD
jgi:hypothetical protein